MQRQHHQIQEDIHKGTLARRTGDPDIETIFHVAREIINSTAAEKNRGREKTCFFKCSRGGAMLATSGHFLLACAGEHH